MEINKQFLKEEFKKRLSVQKNNICLMMLNRFEKTKDKRYYYELRGFIKGINYFHEKDLTILLEWLSDYKTLID